MSFYPDPWEYLHQSRERRARQTGEYPSASYADSMPHSGRTRSSTTYSTEDTYPSTRDHESRHGSSSRSGRRPAPHDYEYDAPPTLRRSGSGRRPETSHGRSSRDEDEAFFDFDSFFSDNDSFFSDSDDPLKARSRRRPAYTRRAPSPPPPPRGGYDFDDGARSGSSRAAPRFVAAEMIEELEDGDPRGRNRPRAPYVYVGTEDPDGTVVDDPFKDGRRGGEAPRGSSTRGRATPTGAGAGEQRGPRSGSGRYEGASSYGGSAGDYSGTYYSASYSSGDYPGGSYGAFYGGYTRGPSSHGGRPYGSSF